MLLNGTIAHFDDTPGCSLYPGTKCGGVIAGKLELPSFLIPDFDLAVLYGEWAVCDISVTVDFSYTSTSVVLHTHRRFQPPLQWYRTREALMGLPCSMELI